MKKIQLLLLSVLSLGSMAYGRTITGEDTGPQRPAYTENKGQVGDQNHRPRPDVLYSGSAGDLVYHLRKTGISYQLRRVDRWKEEENLKTGHSFRFPEQSTIYRLDLEWLGCHETARVEPESLLPGCENYYLPVCPEGALNVRTYTGVIYHDLYKGIGLHYYEKEGAMKYDFLVSAGADYRQIRIRVSGAGRLRLGAQGEVLMETPLGTITEAAPLVTQGGKVLRARWVIRGEELSYAIEGLDASRPFIIDPFVRAWATYYGNGTGAHTSGISSIVTDASGNVYAAGSTHMQGHLIATWGAHQSSYGGGAEDAFLAKFSPSGLRLWATLYGGSGVERGHACAIDPSGNLYLTGTSSSIGPAPGNGIATPGSHQSANASGMYSNAFLAKFNASGQRLWGTYYGGETSETAYTCGTDAAGNVFIGGYAASATGVATPGAYQTSRLGFSDGFFASFTSAGVLQWGTYIGGPGPMGAESVLGCAADPSGNLYVCGTISGTSSIGTPGSFQPNPIGGEQDGFLIKFDASGNQLWGSYYGANTPWGVDEISGCVTDAAGDVYIVGTAATVYASTITVLPAPSPSSLIATPGTHQPLASVSGYDAYLAKFDASGSRQWGTYLATSSWGKGCAIDPQTGDVFVVGYVIGDLPRLQMPFTNSMTVTPGCHQPVFSDMLDGFINRLDASGTTLVYSSFYGGVREEAIYSCALDQAGNLFFAGSSNTYDSTVIATPWGHQPSYGGHALDGSMAGFLGKMTDCPLISSTVAQTQPLCHGIAGGSATVTASVAGSSLTYSWMPSGPASPSLSGLGAGTYTCQVSSGCGLTVWEVISLTDPPALSLTVVTSDSLLCTGQAGTLTAHGSGGTGTLVYTWSAGAQSQGPNTALIHPLANTTYTAIVTDANGCTLSQSYSQVVSQCLGLPDLLQGASSPWLYPNPAAGEITIESKTPVSLTIRNSLGQVILSRTFAEEVNTLQISGYAPGVYLVELKGEDRRSRTVKLVKQ